MNLEIITSNFFFQFILTYGLTNTLIRVIGNVNVMNEVFGTALDKFIVQL